MKEVLSAAGVPTARFATFDALQADDARAFLQTLPGPWVIKTDGLAAGKGVLVARTLDEARDDVTAKLSGAAFGERGRNVVIEEALAGEECSLLVLCDGTTAVPLVPAQDYKRIGDGDVGPNTAGMERTPRCPRSVRGERRAPDGRRRAPARRGAAAPGHRLPRRPSTPGHVYPRRAQGH